MSNGRIKVFVVVNVFQPDAAGGAAVYSDLCFSLARTGFDVTIAAPMPFYPEWRDKSGRNGWRVWRYNEAGASVERYGLYIPSNPTSLFQRLLFEFTFFLSLLRALPRMRQADVILAFCPLAAGVAVAGIARRLFGTPLVLNVQDISADAAATVGITQSSPVIKALRRVERTLFNQADSWTTISPVMVQRLAALRRRNQQVHYIPNWVGNSLAREIQGACRPDTDGRPHVPVRLLYAGNIGLKQELLSLCEALGATALDFTFRICGAGGAAGSVVRWLASRQDPRFSFESLLPEQDFARALAWSDYYVITESAGVGGSFIPSKLLPGLMSGTPIIAVCDPDSPLGVEMRMADPGLRLNWSEVADIGARLESVSAQAYLAWAANAKCRAEAYDRRRLIAEVAQLLKLEASRKRRRLWDASA